MTSQDLSPQELYFRHCAALQIKVNSFVTRYLLSIDAATVTSLDFSQTLLGSKGVLPVLSIFDRCCSLVFLNLAFTGIDDTSCGPLCQTLSQHPKLCTLDLRNNVITSKALLFLKLLSNSWRGQNKTVFSILLTCGNGLLGSSIDALQSTFTCVVPWQQSDEQIPQSGGRSVSKHSPKFSDDYNLIRRRLDQSLFFGSKLTRRISCETNHWVHLGVFVSSLPTFTDEMWLLRNVIIPAVNYRLRRYRINLVVVDLHSSPVMSLEPLPQKRMAPKHFLEVETGRTRNVLIVPNETASHATHKIAVGNMCDIFLGFYDGGFGPHLLTDRNLVSDVLPSYVYHRKCRKVPIGLQSKFSGPTAKDEKDDNLAFRSNISQTTAQFSFSYEADFSEVDSAGVVHFRLPPELQRCLAVDLFSAALAYRSKVKKSAGVISLRVPRVSLKVQDEDDLEIVAEKHLDFTDDVMASSDFAFGIVGEAGTGTTTQLNFVADKYQRQAAQIAWFTAKPGAASHSEACRSLLLQLGVKSEHIFFDFASAGIDDFVKSLQHINVNSKTEKLALLIDNDDLFDCGSFARELVSRQTQIVEAVALPVRLIFASRQQPSFCNFVNLPNLTEEQAVALFLAHISPLQREGLRSVGNYLVTHKIHGLRPHYVVLAAHEMQYRSEGATGMAIAEALPETVDALARTILQLSLPNDLRGVIDSIGSAPPSSIGSMILFALNGEGKLSNKYWTARQWGHFSQPSVCSAAQLCFFVANYARVLSIYDEVNQSVEGNLLRQPLEFRSRVLCDAAKGIAEKNAAEHWKAILARLSFVRDTPFVNASLAHFADAGCFFSSPYKIFEMLRNKQTWELKNVAVALHCQFPSETSREWVLFLQQYWVPITRHPSFLFVFHDSKFPLITAQIDAAFASHPCLRMEVARSHMLYGESDPPKGIHYVLTPSKVSESFVLCYSNIAGKQAHQLQPPLVSQEVHSHFGVISLLTLRENTIVHHRTHSAAICALDLVETYFSVRVVVGAFFEQQIVVCAVIPETSQIFSVGKFTLPQYRPLVSKVALAPNFFSFQNTLCDDGQFCPMFAAVVGKSITVGVEQKYGRDNIINTTEAEMHSFDNHQSFVSLVEFSPEASKICSTDVSGSLVIWGSPKTPCCGTIFAATNFGEPPQLVRFIDAELLFVASSRSFFVWNSVTSAIRVIAEGVSRLPFENKFSLFASCLQPTKPPSTCSPDEKLHYELWLKHERQHPTIARNAIGGVVLLDPAERKLALLKRKFYLQFRNEEEVANFYAVHFEEPEFLNIPSFVSTCDDVGNSKIDEWRWAFHPELCAAIDSSENILKIFDVKKKSQVPLFFARPCNGGRGPFEELSDVAVIDKGRSLFVINSRGEVDQLSLRQGALEYPIPPLTTD